MDRVGAKGVGRSREGTKLSGNGDEGTARATAAQPHPTRKKGFQSKYESGGQKVPACQNCG